MCDLCGNNIPRTYSHSKTSIHKALLLKLFKTYKKNNYSLYN